MGDRVADLRMIGVAVQGAGCRALCEAVIFNVGNWGRRDELCLNLGDAA